MKIIKMSCCLPLVLAVDLLMLLVILALVPRKYFFHYKGVDSHMMLPLGLESGMAESDFLESMSRNDVFVDASRIESERPVRYVIYICKSYSYNGLKLSVEFEFFCGKLMSLALESTVAEEIWENKVEAGVKIVKRGKLSYYYDSIILQEYLRYLYWYAEESSGCHQSIFRLRDSVCSNRFQKTFVPALRRREV